MVNVSEILVTVAVGFAVWYGFRWFKRMAARNEAKPLLRQREAASSPVETLIACNLCGDYAPAGTAPCARANCPRR